MTASIPPGSPPDPPSPPAPAAGWPVEVLARGGVTLGFTAPPGLSLVKAALQAGLRLPASCRAGTCRACMCKLLAGQIRYQVEWPGLLREEQAEGWILPCVAEAGSALRIAQPGLQPPAAGPENPSALQPEGPEADR